MTPEDRNRLEEALKQLQGLRVTVPPGPLGDAFSLVLTSVPGLLSDLQEAQTKLAFFDERNAELRRVATVEVDNAANLNAELLNVKDQLASLQERADRVVEAARWLAEEAAYSRFRSTMSIPAREFRAVAQSLSAYDEVATET